MWKAEIFRKTSSHRNRQKEWRERSRDNSEEKVKMVNKPSWGLWNAGIIRTDLKRCGDS